MNSEEREELVIIVTSLYHIIPEVAPTMETNKAKEWLFVTARNVMKHRGKNVRLDEVADVFKTVARLNTEIDYKGTADAIKKDLSSGR